MLEAELLERDRWSRGQLLAYQDQRVRALITHAIARSPYYREVLGADAGDRPLAELPTLSKTTLMAEFDRIVTDPRLRLADLRAHLAGPDPLQSFLGAYRVATRLCHRRSRCCRLPPCDVSQAENFAWSARFDQCS